MIAFYLGVLVLIALSWLAYRWWEKRVDADIAEGAAREWELLSAREPRLLEGLTREEFQVIFRRVHFPRFPGYALACVSTFFILLPVVFAALTAGHWFLDVSGIAPQPAEFADQYFMDGDRVRIFSAAPPEVADYYASDLAGFYYFFGVAVAWLGVVAYFMRRFHARRPGYIRDEIIRSRKS